LFYFDPVLNQYGRTYPQKGVLTLDSVHTDHCIDVGFVRRKEFKVSMNVNGCGYIGDYLNDSSVQEKEWLYYEGDNASYIIASKSYFCVIDSLSDNGVEIRNARDTLVFGASFQIHEDHRINAMFQEKKKCTIRLSSEGPGKIEWLRSCESLQDLRETRHPQRQCVFWTPVIKSDSTRINITTTGCFYGDDSTISARENGCLAMRFSPDSNYVVSHVIIDKDTLDTNSLYRSSCRLVACSFVKYYFFPHIKSDYSVKAVFKSTKVGSIKSDTIQSSVN
jgi:hypothetical protein